MYVRFVIHRNDERSGRRQGLFQAIAQLDHAGVLLPHQKALREAVREWFEKNLRRPRRLSRSSKKHAKKVAISWFKEGATEHIANMYVIAQILESHGTPVDVIRTERPGYIVYEDEHQVAAEPFSDTAT